MRRREFLAAMGAAPLYGAGRAEITVGITVDTRPDWSGPANFLRSVEEASSVGYRWIETFWQYVERWENEPQALKDILARLNLKLETVSNGGRMRTSFGDPAQREGVIEDHMRLIRFIRKFDCDHLKINCGAPVKVAGAERTAMYKEMAKTFGEIGKRMTDMGMKFGIHAHLASNFETRQDIAAIMELTDPKHVYLIVDTGHVTMAGMDPVELTRTYTHRIIEYHLKDVEPKDKGGYKGPPLVPGTYNTTAQNRIFFELGRGGVDFPGILKILNDNAWKGWFTVELDRTATTAKESCATSKKYIEDVLKLKV
jgi:sugar phosphate isomerase/epimerase